MTRLTTGHGHDDHDNGDDGEGEGREDDRNDSDDSDGGDGVRYGAIEWGPDGDVLYVATDRFADTLELATLDVATGDVEVVYDGGDWNVSDVRIDHGSRTLAVACNIEGYNDVPGFRLDADRELQPLPEPDLPDGVLSWRSFGSDGESTAAAVSTPAENTNVYVTERDIGETERWTNAATAGIPKETFRAPELVRFDSFDGLEVSAFLTVPTAADGDGDRGPFPVVVDIHGGPERQARPSFSVLHQYFLAQGYAVFEPNVRGSSGYGREYINLDNAEKRMNAVADVAAGVEWLADRPAVDRDRVVAYGRSYGGYMVLAALTEYPDLWAAVVDIAGVSNLVTLLENTGGWRREHREAEYGSLENEALLDDISPINSVENVHAPLCVLHGANDSRVPVGEAEQIARAASEHVPVTKLVFENEGHHINKVENRITAYGTVVKFLNEHV